MQVTGGKPLGGSIPPRVCAVLAPFARGFGCHHAHPRHFRAVPLSRLAWLLTVGASFLTALLLLISGYNGYALLAVAVGCSAAINLR